VEQAGNSWTEGDDIVESKAGHSSSCRAGAGAIRATKQANRPGTSGFARPPSHAVRAARRQASIELGSL
jgi:hypothetical protein